MTYLTKHIQLIIIALLLPTMYACKAKPSANTISDSVTAAKPAGLAAGTTKITELSDEQLFRLFFKKFKDAVKTKNKIQLTAVFNFPLQTAPQWTNDELKSTTFNAKDGLVNSDEFLVYFDDIFTKDAVKLVPASSEDDLSEIDKATTENYYLTLTQVTDKGSTLYEFEKQYTEDTGKETSFGFVFGKVKGAYKIISYYRPWPLK